MLSVSVAGEVAAVWYFNADIAELIDGIGLMLAGRSVQAFDLVESDPTRVLVLYDGTVEAGGPWQLLASQCTITFQNGATLADQVGTVE